MLEALPAEDAEFYSKTENLIDWSGKSQATMMEVKEIPEVMELLGIWRS